MRARERTAEAFRALDESWEVTALGPGGTRRQQRYWRLMNAYRHYFKMADGVCYVSQARLGRTIRLSRQKVNLLTGILAAEGRLVVKRRFRRPNIVAPNHAALATYLSRTQVQPHCVKPVVQGDSNGQGDNNSASASTANLRSRRVTENPEVLFSSGVRCSTQAFRESAPRRTAKERGEGSTMTGGRAADAERQARARLATILAKPKNATQLAAVWDREVKVRHKGARLPAWGAEHGKRLKMLRDTAMIQAKSLPAAAIWIRWTIQHWERIAADPRSGTWGMGTRPTFKAFVRCADELWAYYDERRRLRESRPIVGKSRGAEHETREQVEAERRARGGVGGGAAADVA